MSVPTRPDPASPPSVAGATFNVVRKGFEPQEVHAFLRAVSDELARAQQQVRNLEAELDEARQRLATQPDELDEATVTRLLGEEAARILTAAREAAQQTRVRAEEASAKLVREATEDATRLREQSELDAARRRSEAAADAEAELELARQQGREMVDEARAYRERVLGELARRRDLARSQIDQLETGRDRLLGVFQRARQAVDEVVEELVVSHEPAGELDLEPTTGPVPETTAPFYDQSTDTSDELADGVAVVEVVEVVEVTEAVEVTEVAEVPEAGPAPEPADEHQVEIDDVLIVDDREVVAEVEPLAGAPLDALDPEARPTVVALPEPGPTDDDEDDGEDDDRKPAPVVSLFAGEVDRRPKDEVGDLFDRLRAASAEMVARDAAAAGDEADDGEAEEGDAEPPEDTPFTRRDEALVPVIVAVGRKLKRVLADEQNEVLDGLRRTKKVAGLDAIVPAAPDHVARYRSAIDDDLRQACLAGEASTGEPTVDLVDGALEPMAGALESGIVEPLRERLQRAIDQAAGDPDDVAVRVRAVYREWKTQRIDEQVDDLVQLAYGRGAFAALAPGTRVCWLVDPAGPPCPDAEDNALAGEVGAGEAFPTGHEHPPAHAGCRCLLGVTHQ